MSALRRLRAELRVTWRVLLREISRFGAVGFFNLGLDVAVFNLCSQVLGLGLLTSKVIATVISATSAYFMHRHWSFSHRARTGFRREYVLFFFFNAIALAVGLVVIAAARYGLDQTGVLALNLANLFGIGLGTLIRFWSYKRWVFPAITPDELQPVRM
ncbi:MAG: GtrA family protein [Geodermatophilaceae bacterium]|nr:GtrA family protein [Geodermatophilaceae bacterium]MDQ3465343.1 GtrA family protein [Actinomycetota bacterium]